MSGINPAPDESVKPSAMANAQSGRWTLAVYIGLPRVHSSAVASFLRKNASALSERGTAVTEMDRAALDASVSAAAARDAPLVVSSAPWMLRLSSARIVEVDRNVRAHGGRLVAVCVIVPASTLAVHRYVRRLERGSTQRLRRVVLKGINYVPSIRRWDDAIGTSNVWLRAAPAAATARDVVAAFADALSLDVHELWLPPDRSSVPFTGPTAEALRLVNLALADGEVTTPALRRVAVRTLRGATREADPPLTLPPDVARHLDRIILAGLSDLGSRLPIDQRAALVSSDYTAGLEVSRHRLTELFDELKARPRLARVLPDDSLSLLHPDDVRRALRADLTAAWSRGASPEVVSLSAALHTQISSLPDFALVGPRRSTPIPRHLVQYWEPLPVPDYMVPWVESWNILGMAGASTLVSRDEARVVVGDVAGEAGRRAFDLTIHPAQRSDLFRYAALARDGGWYVDADHEALAPHDEVLTWPVEHVFVIRKGQVYPNGFLGCVPGSEVMAQALARACDNVISSSGAMPTMKATGPSMFTEVVSRYLAGRSASAVILPSKVAFGDLLQTIHSEADYKVLGHWRDA